MIIIGIICIIIALNYIPIKFAKNIKQNSSECAFLCSKEPKLSEYDDVNWIARKEENSALAQYLLLCITGNSPDNVLSDREFDVKTWHTVKPLSRGFGRELNNKFYIFYDSYETMDGYFNINATKWYITYPIDRASWRRYFTPSQYLTVYDYDWFNLIRLKGQ